MPMGRPVASGESKTLRAGGAYRAKSRSFAAWKSLRYLWRWVNRNRYLWMAVRARRGILSGWYNLPPAEAVGEYPNAQVASGAQHHVEPLPLDRPGRRDPGRSASGADGDRAGRRREADRR